MSYKSVHKVDGEYRKRLLTRYRGRVARIEARERGAMLKAIDHLSKRNTLLRRQAAELRHARTEALESLRYYQDKAASLRLRLQLSHKKLRHELAKRFKHIGE